MKNIITSYLNEHKYANTSTITSFLRQKNSNLLTCKPILDHMKDSGEIVITDIDGQEYWTLPERFEKPVQYKSVRNSEPY